MMDQIDLDTCVSVPSTVLYRDLGGEAVLLNTESGKYFGLDAVGARMWALLVSERTLRGALAPLLSEYNAPEETITRDLVALAGRLAGLGLLSIEGSDAC
jgi:hypothetical protein